MRAPWFAARRYGLGAGMPIAWQGWVVLAGFLAALALAGAALRPAHPVAWGFAVAGLTIALIAIAKGRTRGGWRWRWGGN